jgi:hypothetical protein
MDSTGCRNTSGGFSQAQVLSSFGHRPGPTPQNPRVVVGRDIFLQPQDAAEIHQVLFGNQTWLMEILHQSAPSSRLVSH